ncbi:leucine-rich repeats and immunoglobulin-like domains protein 1 [Uloborus diversus]|uniref:leucine-rich repeats and immunoglobulin-like domains protein 1 n=1 Tax=Uloborus diversus TaxID=327109 RepID=UPI0024097BAA|nr:leucine-rich repeats and immunoglobulin-like domains protein 1 [Uloborus diversus]
MWILLCCTSLLVSVVSAAECEWPAGLGDSLRYRCTCFTGNDEQRRTVTCGSGVDVAVLVEALRTGPPLDLLQISNSSVNHLQDMLFEGLNIRALRLSGLGIESIGDKAFLSLERSLANLDLQGNRLEQVPTAALKGLLGLRELDLSNNGITDIRENAFDGLTLTTLKLNGNPLRITDSSFAGLEATLRNLHIKSADLEVLPPVKQMGSLSFLDLSQNRISDLGRGAFTNLRQLGALYLERNSIQELEPGAFEGLNASLSSLSLLNNRIEEFPTGAMKTLAHLRVLDLGFNRIHSVPKDAFSGNSLLSLLALDGNPLATLSEETFSHLNTTLRALSIGGSTLVCDCRLRWVVEWVRGHDLQVTSRERNPQFCGRPARLKRRTLPQMNPNELRCDDSPPTSSTSPSLKRVEASLSPTPTRIPSAGTGRDLRAPRTSNFDNLRIKDVVRRGTEVTIHWEGGLPKEDNLVRARVPDTAPVHAMFRIFGEPHFQLGSRVNPAAGWTQFLVPEGRPVVVCVVDSAQAATLSASSVPRNQCSEVTAEKVSDSQLNKMIIGSSAAVCGMIILAVVIFVCCSRRSSDKLRQPARPVIKSSEHEWDTASFYSGRSIPRARAYHGGGSINPSYLPPDDVQSFRSLPPASRGPRGMMPRGGDPALHRSQIALSQLSGPNSFLGAFGAEHQSAGGWGHQWDHVDAYSERHAPSRLSYGKDFG